MKIRFVTWDWKEQPDMEWLLQDVFNGKNAQCVTKVATGGNTYAVVVSGQIIDEKQAQEIYNRFDDLPHEENPRNKVLDIE